MTTGRSSKSLKVVKCERWKQGHLIDWTEEASESEKNSILALHEYDFRKNLELSVLQWRFPTLKVPITFKVNGYFFIVIPRGTTPRKRWRSIVVQVRRHLYRNKWAPKFDHQFDIDELADLYLYSCKVDMLLPL